MISLRPNRRAVTRSAESLDLELGPSSLHGSAIDHELACRNRHGLLAEHVHPVTGELWGNFVQTYSMVGLINAAIRLSVPWDDAF